MKMSGFWVSEIWDLDYGLLSSGLLNVWMFLLKFDFMHLGFLDLVISKEPGGGGEGDPVDGSGPGKQPPGPSLLKTQVRTRPSKA